MDNILAVAADSDLFFNWMGHEDFENDSKEAAKAFLEHNSHRLQLNWTVESLAEDFDKRL